ncbi:hypothetical protein G7Y79_00001g003420 [Physcia stellaris]|nr:hypothetical protein G7Y79_00001g003420 [Physcia stellaris]
MPSNDRDKNSLAPNLPPFLRRRSTTSLFQPEANNQDLPAIELDPSEEIGAKLASLRLQPSESGQLPPQSFKGPCFHRKCPYKHASATNPKLAVDKAREVLEGLEEGAPRSGELVAYLKAPQGSMPEEDRHSPVCPVTKLVFKDALRFREGTGKDQLAPPPRDVACRWD